MITLAWHLSGYAQWFLSLDSQGCRSYRSVDYYYYLTTVYWLPFQVDSIIAYGDLNGRFDHVMGNINTLFKGSAQTDLPIYLVGSKTITFLLNAVCTSPVNKR